MPPESGPSALVESMAVNEEGIALLYQAYMQKFPECAAFWSDLAAEEMGHAAWIRGLAGRVGGGHLHIHDGRFKREAIQSFGKHLQDQLHRAQNQPMPLVTALSIALSVEQALIERRFFEVFEADSADLKQLLQRMSASVEEHIRKVEECWAKYR